jgi:hypothetical protein
MDDLPLDFSRYLGERLGVTSEQADDLLGAWLKSYEPAACGPGANVLAASRSEASSTEGLQRTG